MIWWMLCWRIVFSSPGLILNAVEKYLEDKTVSADDAIKGDGVSEVDVKSFESGNFSGKLAGSVEMATEL